MQRRIRRVGRDNTQSILNNPGGKKGKNMQRVFQQAAGIIY